MRPDKGRGPEWAAPPEEPSSRQSLRSGKGPGTSPQLAVKNRQAAAGPRSGDKLSSQMKRGSSESKPNSLPDDTNGYCSKENIYVCNARRNAKDTHVWDYVKINNGQTLKINKSPSETEFISRTKVLKFKTRDQNDFYRDDVFISIKSRSEGSLTPNAFLPLKSRHIRMCVFL